MLVPLQQLKFKNEEPPTELLISVAEHGVIVPVAIDGHNVIAGHKRCAAAIRTGHLFVPAYTPPGVYDAINFGEGDLEAAISALKQKGHSTRVLAEILNVAPAPPRVPFLIGFTNEPDKYLRRALRAAVVFSPRPPREYDELVVVAYGERSGGIGFAQSADVGWIKYIGDYRPPSCMGRNYFLAVSRRDTSAFEIILEALVTTGAQVGVIGPHRVLIEAVKKVQCKPVVLF